MPNVGRAIPAPRPTAVPAGPVVEPTIPPTIEDGIDTAICGMVSRVSTPAARGLVMNSPSVSKKPSASSISCSCACVSGEYVGRSCSSKLSARSSSSNTPSSRPTTLPATPKRARPDEKALDTSLSSSKNFEAKSVPYTGLKLSILSGVSRRKFITSSVGVMYFAEAPAPNVSLNLSKRE